MNPEKLLKIKERVERTTFGPWESVPLESGHFSIVKINGGTEVARVEKCDCGFCHPKEDAEFIAHAREDIVLLITEYKKAMFALESLTPGGSEFVGDPDACAQYIRDTMCRATDRVKELTRRAKDLAKKLEVTT